MRHYINGRRLKIGIAVVLLTAVTFCTVVMIGGPSRSRPELFATAENGEITRDSMIELAKNKIREKLGADVAFVSELDYEYEVTTEKGKERAIIPVALGQPEYGKVTVMLYYVYLNEDSMATAGIGDVEISHWEYQEDSVD